MATGREIVSFEGDPGQVTSVAISPDGKTALSGGRGELKLWDLATGHESRAFGSGTSSVAMSPDGKSALSVDTGKELKLWDLATGREIRSFQGQHSWITSIAISPDGRTILSGDKYDRLTLWDLGSGRIIRSIMKRVAPVSSAAFRPRSRHVLTGDSGGTVRLWSLVTGRQIWAFEGSGAVTSIAVSADGMNVLAGNDRGVLYWVGSEIRPFQGHSDQVLAPTSVAISADGKTGLSAGIDHELVPKAPATYQNKLKLWDLATQQQIRTLEGHSSEVSAVAISPNGKTALSGGRGELKLWDLATGHELHPLEGDPGGVRSVAISPDGTTALSGAEEGKLKLWNLATGLEVHTFEGHSGKVTSVAISPNGETALSATEEGKLKLWDLATGLEIRTLEGHLGKLTSVAISPDGKTALSGSEDGTVRIWDVKTGKELISFMAALDLNFDWLAATPPRAGGFFNASNIEDNLVAVVRGLEVVGISQLYQSLYNPDLVLEALAGDPDHEVEKAAKELNLEKVLDSGQPPLVDIVTPVWGSSLNTNRVEAEGTISDQGGGIGRIEWRVNGITIVEYPPQGAGKSLSVSRMLPLYPGENVIELVAYNARNLMASVAARTSVTSTAVPKEKAERLHVIVFGLNDYEGTGLPNLRCAVPDAKAIGRALKEAGKGRYASVSLTAVLDPGTVPSEDTDRLFEATSKGLEKALKVVAQEAEVQDTFVFFAAGHGAAVQGRFHLLAKDYHHEGDTDASIRRYGISQEKLQAWIANIKAGRRLILLDTCESGAAVTGASRNDADAALGKLHEATGRPVISAANVAQAALEGYQGHGVFTFAILDALVNGDTNQNGAIEVSEIAVWVQTKTPVLSKELREEGDRGIALGFASQGYTERMSGRDVIGAFPDQISAQKPRTGSRGENFSVVNKLAALPQLL